MCIAAFLWQAHPLYPLFCCKTEMSITTATKEVAWWEDGEILGGRDEVAGGTWLGCSRAGRVALLTNVLELHSLPEARTRGDLPLLFLRSTKSPKEFAEQLVEEGNQYNGFNLILADIGSKSMVYVSNRPRGEPIVIQEVSPGIHVVSNAELDSPWHKAKRLEETFKEELRRYGESEIPVKEMIEKLMRDKVKANESELPHICATDWESNLSSIFVEVDTPLGLYGTRSSAALTVKTNGEVCFYETSLDKDTWKEKTVNYQIQKLN